MAPSAEWDRLGDGEAFYRRLQLYTLTWSLPGGDLADYIVAGSRNGGPLAMTRDDSKPVLLQDSNALTGTAGKRKRVWVYSSAGSLLENIIVSFVAYTRFHLRYTSLGADSKSETSVGSF